MYRWCGVIVQIDILFVFASSLGVCGLGSWQSIAQLVTLPQLISYHGIFQAESRGWLRTLGISDMQLLVQSKTQNSPAPAHYYLL